MAADVPDEAPHIACLKYNVEFLHTVIMEFKEKTALLIDLCFLVLILYIHTFQSGDLAGDFLPAAILQTYGQGAVKAAQPRTRQIFSPASTSMLSIKYCGFPCFL